MKVIMVRHLLLCRELRQYSTRNSGEFRVDLQRYLLLQIPRCLFIRRSSHYHLAECYGRSLCLGFSTDQRITDGMEASRCIFKTFVFSRIHGEQLHGHV